MIFCLFLNMDTSYSFFFNWPYFQTSLLQEERSDRFSVELTSGRASTKHRSFEKATLIFDNATYDSKIPPNTVSEDSFWLQHRHHLPLTFKHKVSTQPERPYWTHTDFEKKSFFINICSLVLVVLIWVIQFIDF